MPRLTTSSASSWAVQWVMGRPDFSGGSQATARIWVTCSGVNLPGAPGRGSSREDLLRWPVARAAWVSRHSMSMRRSQALAQRRRQRPTWRRDRPTLSAMSAIAQPVEGQEDDGGPLPELRGGRGGVADACGGCPVDVR